MTRVATTTWQGFNDGEASMTARHAATAICSGELRGEAQVRLRGRRQSVDSVTSPSVLAVRDLGVMAAGKVGYRESMSV